MAFFHNKLTSVLILGEQSTYLCHVLNLWSRRDTMGACFMILVFKWRRAHSGVRRLWSSFNS